MLPQGYTLRHTSTEDVAAVQALLDVVESDSTGEPRRSEIVVATRFRDPRAELTRNSWVVIAPDDALAGFGFVFWSRAAQGEAEPFVHPDHRGVGLGEALLDAIEARAIDLAAAGTRVLRCARVLPDAYRPARRACGGDAAAPGDRRAAVRARP
jgi:GNAT superfamily N-acetyltransferase